MGDQPLRLLLDRGPITLNPRRSLDAMGQRIGSLLYAALTRVDNNLQTRSSLASSWWPSPDGKSWHFRLRPKMRDHSGTSITPRDVTTCLENYRQGRPLSPIGASFRGWITTRRKGSIVTLVLNKRDPFLPRNVSLLRFFRQKGRSACAEPDPTVPVVGSGKYSARGGHISDLTPTRSMFLEPRQQGLAKLQFFFVRDENTRALMLLRGNVDATQNGLSLSKTSWFKKNRKFKVIERDGVNVTYLAFNLRHPALSQIKVRRAISLAIDRQKVVRNKLFGMGTLASSFLSPLVSKTQLTGPHPDLSLAKKLLNEAGFPEKAKGVRLTLKYKTTTYRIGLERALILREMLKKVGIKLILNVVEPAVFFSSIRRGNFELYTSRWVGVSDASIFFATLHSTGPKNRVGYSDSKMDRLLDQMMAEVNPQKRRQLTIEIQKKMLRELPYFPLWYWKNDLILRKDIQSIPSRDLSLSGALEPLSRLRREL